MKAIRDSLKNNRGFSLTEVIVSSAILTVIAAVMLSLLIQGSNIWNTIINQSDLRSSVRNAMNYMTGELRMATRTSGETPSPNLVINSAPNNHSVDFYLPNDEDSNGLIIDDLGITEWDKSNKIQYQYVPGQRLLRRLEKGEQYVIARDVTSIEFEDNSIDNQLYANELRIILTVERTSPQNRVESVTLTSTVKLRNQ